MAAPIAAATPIAGCATDDHIFDGLGDVAIIGVGVVDNLVRQTALIETTAFAVSQNRFNFAQATLLLICVTRHFSRFGGPACAFTTRRQLLRKRSFGVVQWR